MKKITLLICALGISFISQAQTTLSHSTDETVVEPGVACGASGGATAENRWSRSYVLSDFGITSDQMVLSAQFGVGQLDFSPAVYTVTLNLYTTDAAYPSGTLTLIGSTDAILTAADEGTIVTAVFVTPPTVTASDEVIIELVGTDDDVTAFRIGENTLGETDPSYLQAADCAITVPTPTENIGGGFPDDIILDIIVDDVLAINDNLLAQVSVYPNPASNVINLKVPSTIEVNNIALYDVLGKNTRVALVNGQINIANLSRGVYLLSVKTSAGTLTKKIIKQ